jgi:hypothetical protein
MDNQSQAVERAIAKFHQRNIFKKGDRNFEVSLLFPSSSWRPITEKWWRKKEACVIGEDPIGNLFLSVCDGTVRFWDWKKQEDEVLAPSVRAFLTALRAPDE